MVAVAEGWLAQRRMAGEWREKNKGNQKTWHTEP